MDDDEVYRFLATLEQQHSAMASVSSTAFATRRPSYSGASITKTNEMWQPQHRSGDAAISESWDLLTSRVRDASRNDPAIKKILHQLVRLVIGNGIQTYSSVEDATGNEMEDFNTESDTWFERWCLDEADAENDLSFFEMQQLSFQEVVETGNSFWLRVMQRRNDRTVQLSYQLLEWEQLVKDLSQERVVKKSGVENEIKNGIEFDSRGRKVAYYFYDAHPYEENISSDRFGISRIPASRIIHNYIPPRPSAKCGITWFSAALLPSRDVDWYLGNELTSSAIAALLVMIHRSQNHGDAGSFDDPEKRHDPAKWGHATVAHIGQNDNVEIAESGRPYRDSTAFIDLMNVRLSQACLISVNRFLGDPSQANLASIKAAHQDDAGMAEPIQRHQGRRVARAVRLEHTKNAMALGLFNTVSADMFVRQPYKFKQVDIALPGTGEVQTIDEAPAAIDRMRSGLSTLMIECGRRGLHWKKVIRDMARVNKFAESNDVVLDWTKGQGQVPDSATSIAGDGEGTGAPAKQAGRQATGGDQKGAANKKSTITQRTNRLGS